MDELKPCPWCGHSAEMEPQGYRNEALVFCPKCSRGVTGECGDIDDAIAAWNDLPRNNAKLRAALQKAVNDYGKPGGPWNVPSEPGTWIMMAKDALGGE